MDAEDLKKRTKMFALRILKLAAALPLAIEGKAIKGQLVRAGTSVGANYRSACRGRSRAEFIAKIGIVEEEADEAAFWFGAHHRRGSSKKQSSETVIRRSK